MDDALKKALARVQKSPNSQLAAPATAGLIAASNEDLAASGYPPIPDSYAGFLLQANGARCPAFTLFGSEPLPPAAPDIRDATEHGRKLGYTKDGLVLGEASGNLALIYAPAQKKYRLIDKGCGDALYDFAAPGDFMADWLGRHRL